MGQGQARPAGGAGPYPPGQPNEEDAAAARRRSVGTRGNGAEEEDEEGQGLAPLDLGDEASVVAFMRQKYACVEGGRCLRCRPHGGLLTLTELCVDAICAHLLLYVAAAPALSSPSPSSSPLPSPTRRQRQRQRGLSTTSWSFLSAASESGCDFDDAEEEDEDEELASCADEEGEADDDDATSSWQSHHALTGPFAGLPPEIVDRLLRSLAAHRCLLPHALAALRGCETSALDLSGCRGVTDAWLAPFAAAAAELTTLNLRGAAHVTDAGLARLKGFARLRHVDLGQCCALQGEGVRAALGAATALEAVTLAGCPALTDAALDPLPQSGATLRALNLHGCRCLSDAGLRRLLLRLPALETLSLNQCQGLTPHTLAACLSALPRLRRADLGHMAPGVVGPGAVMALVAAAEGLEALVLDRAGAELGNAGLAALGKLPRLRRLSLRGCQGVTDAGLAYLPPGIEQLDVSHCRGVRRLPPAADALPRLRALKLAHTGVRDADLSTIAGLEKLEELSLDSCRVGNAGLAALARGPPGGLRATLHTLDLTDTGVTDDGLEALATAFPRLASLCLLYCSGVTDHGVRHLSGLRALRRLNLDSREITDAGLLHLSALRELRHLDLFSARVSDVGLCFLGSLASLTGLELCGGKVSDQGLEHLARLPALRLLNVSQNPRVTQRGLRHLARHRHGTLEVLNLSHTQVQVDTSEALGSLKRLRALKVLAVNGCKGVDDGVVRELRASLPYLRTVKTL